MVRGIFTGLVLMCVACGPSGGGSGGSGGGSGGAGGSGGSGGAGGSGGTGGSGGSAFFGAVYAHSADTLYKVDPDTLAVTMVGPFVWSTGTDQMTDIALDRTGNMIGVSFTKVYAVDKMTAHATFLANLSTQFNGLSFIPPAGPDPNLPEKLVGTTLDGSVWEINPMTGASTQFGAYGGDLTSSGDLVSVAGFGTVATVKHGTTGNDFLARVDPTTGVATVIGDTGFQNIWGVGFWKGRVYGFTDGMQFVLIDPNTGVATLQQASNVMWWGAGVTTSAPIVP
jgi:hypothetical protein